MKLAILIVVLALAGSCVGQSDVSGLDPNCNCVYNWIGPHGYYNYWVLSDIVFATYHDADHWTPDPNIEIVPCKVCFVFIEGRGHTFIDQFTFVNDLTIGGHSWDDAVVVVGGPNRNQETIHLRIDYDRVPVIFTVDGERLTNGQTRIRIVGKGFGFIAGAINVAVVDATRDRRRYDTYDYDSLGRTACPYDNVGGCDAPGHPSVLRPIGTQWACKDIRIFHHDSYITCTIDTPDVFPQELEVSVTAFSTTATRTILSTYIQ